MKVTKFDFSLFLNAVPTPTYFDDAGGAGDGDGGDGGAGAGDGAGEGAGAGDGSGDGDGSGEGAGAGTGDGAGAGKGKPRMFTQDEVNSMMAKQKKKEEERVKGQIKELEELKKSKTMTEQDRAKLQTRIEGLQDELLTKEQLSVKEREKLKKTHDEALAKEKGEKDTWRNRYHESEISRAISDAASEAGAFSTEDVGSLLRPATELREEADESGNPTGKFTPKVKFKDTDKEGKPVTLDLTVKEAVKRMKDTPERYGYLFKSTAASGLGMDGGAGRKTAVDVSKMSPAEYREYRKKLRAGSAR